MSSFSYSERIMGKVSGRFLESTSDARFLPPSSGATSFCRRPCCSILNAIASTQHERRLVTYLYSLYDALVSIAVPSDKARAVVDAMERDMGNTLATKQDLLLMKQDFLLVKQDISSVRQELRQEIQLVRQELESGFKLVDQRLDSLRSDLSRDLAAQRQSIIVQLGSVIVACFGLTLAFMRFWT